MIRHILPVGAELDARRLEAFIGAHRTQAADKRTLYDYYHGNVTVDKGDVAEGRPNNQAYTNLAKYITDTATGYFVGVPPVYTVSEGEDVFSPIFDANDETSVNYAIAEDMSICGVGYDIVWLDETGSVRIKELDPLSVFTIRAPTVDQPALYAVRLYDVVDGATTATYGELYSRHSIRYFTLEGGAVRWGEEEAHFFGAVPITEYPNSRFCTGDFEAVLKNIDQYNLTLSNATDDLQSIANAYLAIVGMMGTAQEDIEEMNRTRVALLAEQGQMQFVTKNLDSTAVENHKDTLRQDIFRVAGVPDLSDDFFSGNASGVALRFKLWGMDQLFARKRAYMESGLFRRLRLIAGALNLLGNNLGEVSDMISVRFTQNMPKDVAEKVDAAVKLSGLVSTQTMHEQLEPVTTVSAQEEARRMAQEEVAEVGVQEEVRQTQEEKENLTELGADTQEDTPTQAAGTKKKKSKATGGVTA